MFQLSDEAQELEDFCEETATRLEHLLKRLSKQKDKVEKVEMKLSMTKARWVLIFQRERESQPFFFPQTSSYRRLGDGQLLRQISGLSKLLTAGGQLTGKLGQLGQMVRPLLAGGR